MFCLLYVEFLEEISFLSLIERFVDVVDVILYYLVLVKEMFGDLEVVYRIFKYELEIVKIEYVV